MELIRLLLEIVGALTIVYWVGQAVWQMFSRYQIRKDARARLDEL